MDWRWVLYLTLGLYIFTCELITRCDAIGCDLGIQPMSLCGYANINQSDCEQRDCCYNGSRCYIPQQELLVGTYQPYNGLSSHCYFPFMYNGKAHFKCTEEASPKRLWCGQTATLSYNEWAYCKYECLKTSAGLEYAGNLSVIVSGGEECDRWDAHSSSSVDNYVFPDGTVSDALNYCRNPDSDSQLWCYRVGGAWGYCEAPVCDLCDKNLLYLPEQISVSTKSASSEQQYLTANEGVIGRNLAWCAKQTDNNPFLQVEFSAIHRVWGVATLGRGDKSIWVTQYKLSYSIDGSTFTTYKENGADKVFKGNADSTNMVGHAIKPTFGKTFRIYPTGYSTEICLRWDLIGCDDENNCEPNPCQNNGTCFDRRHDYFCQCKHSFMGKNCSQDFDECASTPCKNGGVCLDSVNSYTCNCQGPFSGVHCEHGVARSCVDIARAGVNISDYYNINFYEDILSDACEMLQLPFYLEDVNTELFQFLVENYTDHSLSSRNVTAELCKSTCLQNSNCTMSMFSIEEYNCSLWSGIHPIDYIDKGLIGYYDSKLIMYVKQCPRAVPIYCNMTDPERPVTSIVPPKKSFKIPMDSRNADAYSARLMLLYPSATSSQLNYLKYDSMQCEQVIGVRCEGADVNFHGFYMADNNTYPLNSKYNPNCGCFLSQGCASTCNCAGYGGVDWGTIHKKSMLPALAFVYGDKDEDYEILEFYIEDLKCTQAVEVIDECSSNPCLNGGNCTDGQYNFACACPLGFGEYNCVPINECASNPCVNGATCLDLINKYECTCIPGYGGINCETDINECASTPCYHDGSCVDLLDKYFCLCRRGTMGEYCETDIDDCVSAPCLHDGTCTDLHNNYTCTCPAGYESKRCELDKDECSSHPCQNGGSCTDLLNDYVCSCAPGYTGRFCQTQINECESQPCMNNGYCKDTVAGYVCVCSTGFTSVHCETNIDECSSSPCVHGQCQDGVHSYICQCKAGYSGWTCHTEDDECSSDPCVNNGTCTDNVNSFTCTCPPGYTGDMCQIDINECGPIPCKNGGTCKNQVNQYKCTCMAGYTGTNCELIQMDGQWGGWESWTHCSVQCGQGVHTRTRDCNNPPPRNGGKICDGVQSEGELCYTEACTDINGNWGMWGQWGDCTQTCNYGSKLQKRKCDTPAPKGNGRICDGTDTSTALCKLRDCGSPVDGEWSLWGPWSTCSSTCGIGTTVRTRQCDNPPPVYGGTLCQGTANDWQPCFTEHCPAFTNCGLWTDWSSCSATCGGGLYERQRTCKVFQVNENLSSNTSQIYETKTEYGHQHCEEIECEVPECYHCSSQYTGKLDSLLCKGPTKQCKPDQPFCIYVFSKEGNSSGITKRCANSNECTPSITKECSTLWDQTFNSVIIDETLQNSVSLQPHTDTLAEMWDSLETKCSICCKSARCNRGFLPARKTIYIANSAVLFGLKYSTFFITLVTLHMIFSSKIYI